MLRVPLPDPHHLLPEHLQSSLLLCRPHQQPLRGRRLQAGRGRGMDKDAVGTTAGLSTS